MSGSALQSELHYWVGLSLAPGLGPAGTWRLMERCGSAARIFSAPHAELCSAGLRSAQLDGLRHPEELLERAAREIEKLQRLGGRPIAFWDPDYPDLLRQTAQPPPVLYVRGNTRALHSPAVALIGSRSATSYGRRAAARLARDLGRMGVVVVSGLAVGVDGAAHGGCLEGDGLTIGVLGCGLDVVYPRANNSLYEAIGRCGLLVSEYPLGTKPDGFRFPARNRIIAGLCLAVVVVEATRKSGSMITVQFALDEGREVGAIPGQVDSPKSGGSHWLLQQGASLIVSADDIVELLRLEAVPPPPHRDRVDTDSTGLGDRNRKLLELIEPYPMSRDELLRISGLAPPVLSEILLLLELEGAVELLPGDRVRRLV